MRITSDRLATLKRKANANERKTRYIIYIVKIPSQMQISTSRHYRQKYYRTIAPNITSQLYLSARQLALAIGVGCWPALTKEALKRLHPRANVFTKLHMFNKLNFMRRTNHAGLCLRIQHPQNKTL